LNMIGKPHVCESIRRYQRIHPASIRNICNLSHFVYAILFHDIISSRSVTGILHVLNQTPIDWFSKKRQQLIL